MTGFGANAVPINKDHERARIYRIRRGWQELGEDIIKQDAADCFEIPVIDVTEDQKNTIINDYLWCWNNWPVDLGAPYIDRNHNGIFDPPPPAAGYDLLQGPAIPSRGNVAIFNLKYRQDYKNLEMSGFGYLATGSPYSDPIGGYDIKTLNWYKLLRGYAPLSGPDLYYHHPPGVTPGPFPLAGDPVSATGHIDGLGEDYSFAPSDRRLVCSIGPWVMAPGDTQEVVFAIVCGLGADRLSSISVLKFNDRFAQKYYDSLLSINIPQLAFTTSYPTDTTTAIQLQTDLWHFSGIIDCEIYLTPLYGSESTINIPLYDDGIHNDSLAGDNIYGNSIVHPNRQYPVNGNLIIQTSSGQDTLPVLSDISLRPVPQLINWRISWENGLQDLNINIDEKIHLSFDILNTDNLNSINRIKIINFHNPELHQTIHLDSEILPGTIAINDSLFFAIDGPAQGDSISFTYQIGYDQHSELFSLSYPVVAVNPGQNWGDTLDVVSQVGVTYNVFPIVADPSQLTDHGYRITFINDINDSLLKWQLTDITTNEIKLNNALISDNLIFPHPVIDGILFKVIPPEPNLKSIECVSNASGPLNPPKGAAANWNGYPTPERPDSYQQVGAGIWLISTRPNGDRISFDDFLERTFQFIMGTGGVEKLFAHDFEIRFTDSGGKAFDYWKTKTVLDVPFELWDIKDINNPDDDYQLVPYLFDNDENYEFNLQFDSSDLTQGSGWADHEISGGKNDPWTDPFYWIHPTDDTPGSQGYNNMINALIQNPAGAPSWMAQPGDVAGDLDGWAGMHRMVLVNWNGGNVSTAWSPGDYNQEMPETGTIFRIIMPKPNYPGDQLLINTILSISGNNNLPNNFYLHQNFPNPFNPVTNIRFSLAKSSKVKLEIFNILGQKVATLIDKKMPAGKHSVIWKGRDDFGTKVGSGIYFYRFKAGEYIKKLKMTLFK